MTEMMGNREDRIKQMANENECSPKEEEAENDQKLLGKIGKHLRTFILFSFRAWTFIKWCRCRRTYWTKLMFSTSNRTVKSLKVYLQIFSYWFHCCLLATRPIGEVLVICVAVACWFCCFCFIPVEWKLFLIDSGLSVLEFINCHNYSIDSIHLLKVSGLFVRRRDFIRGNAILGNLSIIVEIDFHPNEASWNTKEFALMNK